MIKLRAAWFRRSLALVAVVAGMLVVVPPPAAGAAPVVDGPGSGIYYAVSPTRVLDTRTASGAPCIQTAESRFVTVSGSSGVPLDASAVVVNVTAVGAVADGFVTAFPAGEDRPATSTLNYRAGQVVANSATVKMGVLGQLAVFANTGCPNVLIDVVGFYSDGSPNLGGYQPLSPVRRLDTRSGATRPCVTGLERGETINTLVAGGGVPTDATSVTVNVTVVNPTALSFLTLFPAGSSRPTASTINFTAGEVRANQTTVQLGAGGFLSVFNHDGCVDVIIDVVGFTASGSGPSGSFLPQAPTRLLDTRDPGKGGCIAPGTTRDLVVDPIFASRIPPRLYSVTVNITVTGPVGDGFVTVFPTGATRPGTSNVNFSTGQTVANGAVVQLGALGKVSIFSNNGCPHVIVDAAGITKLPKKFAVVSTVAGYGVVRDGVRSAALDPEARLVEPGDVETDAAGNVYFTDRFAQLVRKVSVAGKVTTLAGRPQISGSTDGPGAAARFSNPNGIARDSAGNLYVTSGNAIRKVTPSGVVSTVAGSQSSAGTTNGAAGLARFFLPSDVAVDAAGVLYVADTENHQIRKIATDGTTSLFAGAPNGAAGNVDAAGTSARFSRPTGLDIDAAGNLFVADRDNGKVRKITPAGVVTTVFGCPPTNAGDLGLIPTGACFYVGPTRVAVLSNGHLVVNDPGRAVVSEITPGATTTVAIRAGTPGTSGLANGAGTAALFSTMGGVAPLPDGSLLVGDTQTLRKLGSATATPANQVSTFAGELTTNGTGGTGNALRFGGPTDAVAVSTGEILVTDVGSNTIRRVRGGLLNTRYAGQAGVSATTDGDLLLSAFRSFSGMVRTADGTLYVADPLACVIRKVTLTTVSTLAGTSGSCSFANGTGAAARFNRPEGLALDSAENLYVADADNNRIRKVTPAGVVTTVVGSGTYGSSDNASALLATLGNPEGVAVDPSGNIYVADTGGGTIRKAPTSGGLTTLAGDPSLGGLVDATGSAARFMKPTDIVADGSASVLVVDGRRAVRRVTSAGVVTTVAGDEIFGFPADASAEFARFGAISGISLDTDGNLLVAEGVAGSLDVNTVRKITFLP